MITSQKNNQISVNSALWILRISYFFCNFMPSLAIIVLIYTQKGVTLGDFFLIEGIFRLTSFLLEIPSGYLADRFSRKHVLSFAILAHGIGFGVLAFAHGFWQIVLAEAILGISSALFSGTLGAYTYDLLKRDKAQSNFLKEMGSISTWCSAANFIAALIGPAIYNATHQNGALIIGITAITSFISLVLSLWLPNLTEVIRKKQKNKSAFMDIISITTNTMKNPKLRNLIWFPALFGSFTIVMLWMLQPIMKLSNIPIYLFGIFFSIYNVACIFLSKYAYKICKKFGEINTSILTIFSVVLWAISAFIAMITRNMTVVYIAVAIMSVGPAIRILNNLQYNTLIHDDIESQERGTVLSTRAMISTLFSALSLSCAKYLVDMFGIQPTIIVMLVATILLFISLNSATKYIPHK